MYCVIQPSMHSAGGISATADSGHTPFAVARPVGQVGAIVVVEEVVYCASVPGQAGEHSVTHCR